MCCPSGFWAVTALGMDQRAGGGGANRDGKQTTSAEAYGVSSMSITIYDDIYHHDNEKMSMVVDVAVVKLQPWSFRPGNAQLTASLTRNTPFSSTGCAQ